MNILLVEDDVQSIDSCQETAALYDKESINIEVAKNLSEAKSLLQNKDIDTAIVDIKLGENSEAGNSVINEINDLNLRIPTVVHTGTPDSVQVDVFKIFTKGESSYQEIFKYLWSIYNTGITEIIGGKGLLERQINKFYSDVFIKSKDSWINKVDSLENKTEDIKKSLLRTAIYHIEQLLEDSNGKTFFEEFYLYSSDNEIHTGSLLNNKQTEKYYVVISPACDLVKRDSGQRNVDVVTLCEIDLIEKHGYTLMSSENDNYLSNTQKDKASSLLSNSKNRYHFIPRIDNFTGGLLDFTKTIFESELDLNEKYNFLAYRISPPYIKNILSRFSSYYARQGQPDLDITSYLDTLTLVR